MSFIEDQFLHLSDKEKWNLYSKATVDSTSFEKMSKKLEDALTALGKCEEKISALESQIAVNQAVTKHLSGDNLQLKKRLNKLEQYGRKENVVVTGIPPDTADVEKKLICILKNSGVNVHPSDITACHPVKKRGNYIIRFVNRKVVQEIFSKRRQVEAYNSTEVWGKLTQNHFYPNLLPTYSRLRYIAKKLRDMGSVHHFGSNVNGVWVQKESESVKIALDCDEDVLPFLPEGKLLSDLLS